MTTNLLVKECIALTHDQERLILEQEASARIMTQKMAETKKAAARQREILEKLTGGAQQTRIGVAVGVAERMLVELKDVSTTLSNLMNEELNRVPSPPATPWLETVKKGQTKPAPVVVRPPMATKVVARPPPPTVKPASKNKESLTDNDVLRADLAQMTARVAACEDEIEHLRKETPRVETKTSAPTDKELADTRAMLSSANKRLGALEADVRSRGVSWQKEKDAMEKEMLRVLSENGRKEVGSKEDGKKEDGKKKDRAVVLTKAMDQVRQLGGENQDLKKEIKRLAVERGVLEKKVTHWQSYMSEFKDGVQAIVEGVDPSSAKMDKCIEFLDENFPLSLTMPGVRCSGKLSDAVMQSMMAAGNDKFYVVKLAK